jgi:hypothetical protein
MQNTLTDYWKRKKQKIHTKCNRKCVMFRAVFWVILPCKMIVDRRFRDAYCLHHQGWVSLARNDRGLYRCPVPGWPIVVRDDRLVTGQWQWAGSWSRRERGISGEDVKWVQLSPWKGLVERPGCYQCDREVTTGLAEDWVVLRRTDVPTTPVQGAFYVF